MNKILTIAIPTFNRPDCLKILISKLLNANLMELIEVNVHDNSDRDIQNLNKESCTDVNYFPNLSNIGYGGNVRACIKKAKGQYLYIISDDDDYNFSAIVSILKLLEKRNCGVLALTCSLGADTNMKFNTLYHSLDCDQMTLGEILDRTEVVTPFNLLPSMIFETAIMKRGERLFCKGDNDYMHSMIFLMGANRDTKVKFDNSDFLVTYNVPEAVQNCFELFSLLSSKEEITKVLEQRFNVTRRAGLEILEVSKWCFMSGINGSPKVQIGFRKSFYFALKSMLALRFLPIAFCWLGLLPSSLRGKFYELYLKLKRI